MIGTDAWAERRYAVYGLARSGLATVRTLLVNGAEVEAWDDSEMTRDRLHLDVPLVDPSNSDLSTLDAVVVSPGVPLNTHPLAARARAAGVPLIGDVELFAQARPDLPAHRVVGITGTNGKSTVTALVHHMCATAGVASLALGNIGEPILAAEPLPAGGVYVLELSSYQIDLTSSLDCDVAALLNVTPDHLDRYPDFAAYAASKERLFAMQSPDQVAVVALTDDTSAAIAARAPARVRRVAPGVCLDQSRWPALSGPHNAANALVAIEIARALRLPEDAIDQALESFSGLPHRLESVGERGGVRYVNDSKATNPEAAAPALAAFDRVHWILGGRAKGPDLGPALQQLDHVVHAYVIGEAGSVFADALEGRVPVSRSGTLEAAVREAADRARSGDTVLLSPAAASFDQFADFADRGERFRQLVEALPC